MELDTPEARSAVARARCVLFAYHEMGYACMEALLAMGAPIVALFTHRDDPHEEVWWRSCAELAKRNSIPVYEPGSDSTQWIERIGELRPSII
ncbi:MAG TPA: hypothetical protein VNF45_02720, partial [Candidatus Binataceae bacterium]|nr:hypothetical protein [Candidatus Binataceae bacterium]